MSAMLRLTLLPLRAPMLLVLLLISTYLGVSSTLHGTHTSPRIGDTATLLWSVECLQALLVVVICTVPHLLLRQLSSLMSSSRVFSLVISLLLVTMGGLYLLHLEVLAQVLILGSAVLLARLDLVRVRVLPPPLLLTAAMVLLVLAGLSLGRLAGPMLVSRLPFPQTRPLPLRSAPPRFAPAPALGVDAP